jgi:hypothetical protein
MSPEIWTPGIERMAMYFDAKFVEDLPLWAKREGFIFGDGATLQELTNRRR